MRPHDRIPAPHYERVVAALDEKAAESQERTHDVPNLFVSDGS